MHPHGWRLSVGLAIVPALMLFLGSIIIPDTPNSWVKRGYVEKARLTLERVRGTPDVEAEFADIVEANDNSKNVNKMAIFQRKYRPVLVSLLPFCPVCLQKQILARWPVHASDCHLLNMLVIRSACSTCPEGRLMNMLGQL